MNFLFNKTMAAVACYSLLACLAMHGIALCQDDSAGIALEQAPRTDRLAEALSDADPSVPATGSLGLSRSEALIASLTIFSLAVFVGFEIITKVPPTLHTPLMSGSNAISGISLVGAALVTGGSSHGFASFLGMLAVALAAVNVVGGFMVTDRMLSMFQGKKKKKK